MISINLCRDVSIGEKIRAMEQWYKNPINLSQYQKKSYVGYTAPVIQYYNILTVIQYYNILTVIQYYNILSTIIMFWQVGRCPSVAG